MKKRTTAQTLHVAQQVKIRVAGCDRFIRVNKSDLHVLKNELGGWDRLDVQLSTGGVARVTVKPA